MSAVSQQVNKTVKDILVLAARHLEERSVSGARRSAEELVSHILGLERLQLYLDFERPLEADELQRCRQGLQRLANKEPWQYVVGEVSFYNCSIQIDDRVLIPRQETEILVDKIVEDLKKKPQEEREKMTVWDLCCGSGCIGISLKKRFPELTVVLSDISESAVAVAKGNVKRNDVDVEVRMGDLFSSFVGEMTHMIVCNPPYVTEEEYENLEVEVKCYEPKISLVGGASGLEVYEEIAQQVEGFLLPKGKLWMEIGTRQGKALQKVFAVNGIANTFIEKDWAGHDRFFLLENQ